MVADEFAMTDENETKFEFFTGDCFSDLFERDITFDKYAFLLSYPSTAKWSPYPNTAKYYIQDGNLEENKVGFDKIRQKEPWKIMAVLGNGLPGILTSEPPDILVRYWKEHFGFGYENMTLLPHESWGHFIREEKPFEKLITLFPYDRLPKNIHAVDPDSHYDLLSKCTLGKICPNVPGYTIIDMQNTLLKDIEFPSRFPFCVKTSHGLSGEGTYIVENENDLTYCKKEIAAYMDINLVDFIVIMKFVQNVIGNYCVQFYVDRACNILLIGATSQLVTKTGIHLGGIIRYNDTDIKKFLPLIGEVGRNLHRNGYFGVVGIDILEDGDKNMHIIDANIRVNGSTPLCLQKNTLVSEGREIAKYTTDYWFDDTLDQTLVKLKIELDKKEFVILSALEYHEKGKTRTEIYGIVAGRDIEDMIQVEKRLEHKGLMLMS